MPSRLEREIDIVNPEVFAVASQIVRSQRGMPVSPCDFDNGGTLRLCAAAALASAGLACTRGPEARTRFEGELARTLRKETVREAFAELGWSVVDCNRRMRQNDGCSAAERTNSALQRFR
jgi:hypothetical protein